MGRPGSERLIVTAAEEQYRSTGAARKSRASLLVRHRWIRILDGKPPFFCCHARAHSLYNSVDPLCHGCGAILVDADVPGYPRRFQSSRWALERGYGDAFLESLGVALDLAHESVKFATRVRA